MRRGAFAFVVGLLLAFIYVGQTSSAPARLPLTVGERGAQVCKAEYLLSRKRVVSPRRGFSVQTLQGRHVRKAGCRFDVRDARATRNAYWKLGWPRWYVKSRYGARYGPMLHAVLQGKARRPLKYRVEAGKRAWRATENKPSASLSAKQRFLVSTAQHLVNKRYLVLYSQATRMQIVRLRLRIPPLTRTIFEDCSSSVTGLYWRAGLPDPNGLGFNGYGYTGTQSARGKVVWRRGDSLSRLRPGDLIFYGRGWPYGHVTMYLGGGRVFSHGSSPGPYNLPALYRTDASHARRYFG